MYGKNEVLARVAELEAVSPSSDCFAALREAIDAYFAPDEEMRVAVATTIHHIGMEYMERNSVYEHQELVPAFPSADFPPGYDDVTEIFDGGGVWDEMMAVDMTAFIAAFQPVEASEDGGAAPLVNSYVTGWTARITTARGVSVEAVKNLGEFCANGTLNYGIAVFFEELGERTYMPEHRETAERVFLSGGFKALIYSFGLDVHVPSYLK